LCISCFDRGPGNLFRWSPTKKEAGYAFQPSIEQRVDRITDCIAYGGILIVVIPG